MRDATSSISGGFYKTVTEEVTCNCTASTPHHYLIQLTANWGDQLKETMSLSGFKVQADIECDESLFIHPTTFSAQGVFLKMIALHAQVMSNNARDRVIMGQADVIARVTKSLYGGAKIIYDDKARSFEMARYGMFWKAQKNFLVGLEYNKTGDF